jgi:hypothetical protein
MIRHPKRAASPLGLLVAVLLTLALLPHAAVADETVMVCDIYGNHVAPAPAGVYGIGTSSRCPGNAAPANYNRKSPPGGLAIWTLRHKAAHRGGKVAWRITAPGGLVIASVYLPHMYSWGIDEGNGWGGGLTWKGGSGGVSTFDGESSWSSTSGGPRFNWPRGGTRHFGWRVVCRASRCHGGNQWLSVELLELRVREARGPVIVARDGLWQARGWIRGQWRLHFYGDSPTGLCGMSASLNGKPGPGTVSGQDAAVWHQCAAAPVDQTVDTSQYGQGVMPLTLRAIDAAGESVSHTKTIRVDNVRPAIALSGPTDAPSTAGTQYIRATGTAGPSGVAGIACSLDLGSARWYAGSTAEVPVHGVGIHHLSCYSESHARDEAGTPAASVPVGWTLKIRSPSVSTVSFVRIADALRCVHRHERVWIPAHWATGYRHGHRVRVRVPGQSRRVEVVHCHPRVVHRRVRRDGHWTTERVVLLPHRVSVRRLQVPFGKRTSVSGWLGTSGGNALGGQLVRIFTAPDNGSRHFTQAAVARTSQDGVWNTVLPAGPSRLVVAVYDGAPTVEPAFSAVAHLAVPAKITLHIHPRATHWGGTIRISGQVHGGYVPHGGEVVFLWVSWRGGKAYAGHIYTRSDGRLSTKYTFLRGTGTAVYTFWLTSGREGDYPYASGRSNRIRVTVGS